MADKKILFICDSHLGSDTNEPKKEILLIEFIRNLSSDRVSALYILGDLFDFWFEYKSVIPLQYFHVLVELAQTVKKGIEIHLVVGNHDFWAGDFLKNTIGLKIHYDPIETEINGRRVYMCHGDGLNPYDRSYRILRAILRNRATIWIIRRLHPDRLRRIARRFSKLSRESSSVAGKLREDEGIRQFAMGKFDDGIDVFIAGHSHQPHDETHSIGGKTKRYLNVGDMYKCFSYLEYSKGKFQLQYLSQNSQK